MRVDLIPTKRRMRSTKSGKLYPDPRNAPEAEAVRAAYEGPMHEGAVVLYVEAHSELPKSRPKKVSSEHFTGKPDADNMAKAVMDALNGIAYEDDRQVVLLISCKMPRERGSGTYIEYEVMDTCAYATPAAIAALLRRSSSAIFTAT